MLEEYIISRLPNSRWQVSVGGHVLSGSNGCVDLDTAFKLIKEYQAIIES